MARSNVSVPRDSSDSSSSSSSSTASNTKNAKTATATATSDASQSSSDSSARALQLILCILVAIAAYVYVSPSPIAPVAFRLASPPSLSSSAGARTGAGAGAAFPVVNTVDLAKAQPAWRGRANKGPESVVFAPQGDYAYFGAADGKILRGSIASPLSAPEPMTTIGDPNKALPLPCGTYETLHICGRALGMAYHPNGFVIIAAAYFGLLAMDPASGQLQAIATTVHDSLSKQSEELLFPNSVAVAADGKIYFTISSNKHSLRDYMLEILESGKNGGVGVYDPKTRKATYFTKRNSLSFPNGIVLSEDGSYLIVAELNRARLVKIPLSGPKKGIPGVYIENLPVLPDNIRWASEYATAGGAPDQTESGDVNQYFASGNDLLLVTGTVLRSASSFSLFDFTAPRPWLRKLLAKAIPVKYIAPFVEALGGGATIVAAVKPPVSSAEGAEVAQVIVDTSGKVRSASEVRVFHYLDSRAFMVS